MRSQRLGVRNEGELTEIGAPANWRLAVIGLDRRVQLRTTEKIQVRAVEPDRVQRGVRTARRGGHCGLYALRHWRCGLGSADRIWEKASLRRVEYRAGVERPILRRCAGMDRQHLAIYTEYLDVAERLFLVVADRLDTRRIRHKALHGIGLFLTRRNNIEAAMRFRQLLNLIISLT
jgi:hypothetical protein